MKKMHESILNRITAVEQKYGIKYAKTDGRLYRILKVIYILFTAYTLGINLLFLMGELLMYSGTDNFKYVIVPVITVSICTAALIAALVLICCGLQLIGGSLTLLSSVFSVTSFASLLKDDLGYFGYKASFYWRHLIPMLIIALLAIWIAVIAERAKHKLKNAYKRITENLYNQYSEEYSSLSDEQWDEFLENYDPRNYKKQFKPQIDEE